MIDSENYYNLLMSGNEEAWTGASWTMDYTRVFEYTHEHVKGPFAALDDSALQALMGLPTLFAYEKSVQLPARVGRVTQISRRQQEFAFTFTFDLNVAPIESAHLLALTDQLDISKYEVNRSHWAVKNVDLAAVLREAGLTTATTLAPPARPPLVFISYSWDSPEHRTWVAELAGALRANGIDVLLDQWHMQLGEDMGAFMANAVRRCDRVLLVCTEPYVQKAQARVGGVGYEQAIITGQMMRDVGTTKFIPVIRQANPQKQLPDEVAGRYFVDLSAGADSRPEFQSLAFQNLIRALHNVPTPIPPLGPRPAL